MSETAKDIDVGLRTRFWQLYEKELQNQLDKKKEALIKGQAQTYADYRELVGTIQGLELALKTPKRMLAREQSG